MKLIKKVHIISIICLLLMLSQYVAAQESNYVMEYTFLNSSSNQRITDINYYDGLGRKTLSASNGIGTSGKYVYNQTGYDLKGRISTESLSIPGGMTVSELSTADIHALGYSYYSDHVHYETNGYDALDRPISIQNPGIAWVIANKAIRKVYGVNAANSVKHYTASIPDNNLSQSGYYPAISLTMEQTTDEDNHVKQVYKDLLEHVVLERSISGEDTLDTYYVYNDKAQLCYVLNPEYQFHGYKDMYAYEYRYNERGLVDKKILPHCDYEQYYYDNDGRVIYQRDVFGRFRFFFYDTYGRQVMKGKCSNFNYHHYSDVSMQSGQDGLFGTGYVYSQPSAITGGIIDEVVFYDDYQFLSKPKFSTAPQHYALIKTSHANATGLQTGSIVRTSADKFELTAIYYDDFGRITDKRELLSDGSVRTTVFTYSFTDKPLTEATTLNRNGSVTTEVKTYTYYPSNDKLQIISIAYNGSTPETVAEYTYNDLGQITTLSRGGNAGNIGYTYNLRGWTTAIDGPGFKEWLHYADGQGTPCYSGNISSQQWKLDYESFKRGYKFTYDGFGRMQKAAYGEGDDFGDHVDRYTEWVKEYMQSGGIRKIERYGKKSDGKYGKIDNLRFYYNGMQVQRVKEDALPVTNSGAFDFVSHTVNAVGDTEYAYYADGSLKWDANKGISRIEYDRFGNPKRIQFSNGNVTEYLYSATGEKRHTIFRTAVPNITVSLGSTIHLNSSNTLSVDSVNYYGSLVFENGQLSKGLFDGGYATFSGGQPTFHYYTKDHLGNNRAVVNHDGTLEQAVHYYPFGATYYDTGRNINLQRYKYNGKELDRMHGLNFYDYSARQYDPLLCRFTQIDPLAEKYYWISPYVYCANNPVNAIDPDGKSIWSKGLKGLVKVGRSVAKNGLSTLKKADTYLDVFSDVTDAINTLTDANASIGEKVVAGASLASELLPVSVGDVKDAGKIVKMIINKNQGHGQTYKKARFVVDPQGRTVDTQNTPPGSYIQPNGDRTDILQKKSHYNKRKHKDDGYSHTHPKVENVDKEGTSHYNYSIDTHQPTYEEIKNIENGNAL